MTENKKNKKAPSRRMQKQGPPPSLNESLVTKKRKAGGRTSDGTTEKKRRVVAETKPPRMSGALNGDTKRSRKAEVVVKSKKTGKKASPPPVLEPEIDDLEESADGIDDPDVMEDGLGGADLDEFDDLSEDSSDLQDVDDFLGSDSGSEVLDSDAEDMKEALWSEDDADGSDVEEQLNAANMEALSRRLDMKAAEEAAEAQAELEESGIQTNIAGERPRILGEAEEEIDEEDLGAPRLAPDLQLLRTRIAEAIRVLGDFANLAEEGRSRIEYRDQLLKDICAYYGYNKFLAEKLFNLFPPDEAYAFFEANETPRPVVIRTNTLRTHRRELAQSLINRGVTLEPVGRWSKVGLQIFESQVPLGATPEYLAGHYILQAASSFLPVMALAPQEHERILDMASAPGGKVTHIAALMKNTGCIFANDSNRSRSKGLIGNVHRLGVKNTVIVNEDALVAYPKLIGGFDRVLLDAPCSGTGVIAKDPSVKTNRIEKDFLRLPHLQKRLLLAAIDSVDHGSSTGGFIVYSTCSVAVEENEQVVNYALSRRPNVKLVPTGLTFGKEGFVSYMGKKFHTSLRETRRFYPHAHNMDGFFVAKFKKTGPTPANAVTAMSSSKEGGGKLQVDVDVNRNVDELADNTPITTEDESDGSFGDWDEEEDAKYMKKAKKASLIRKGRDPRTAGLKGKGGKSQQEVASKEELRKVGQLASGNGEILTVNGREPKTSKAKKKSRSTNGPSEKHNGAAGRAKKTKPKQK